VFPERPVLSDELRGFRAAPACAPVAPNLVVHRSNRRRDVDLQCLIGHRVELVITCALRPSVGR
jgi:nitronate monooxygenase